MAAKIRGITIDLGLNTSKFASDLKGVNSELKGTQKQLNDVEKLLKLDPSNVELLKQKQTLLNDAIGKTNEKLTLLKSEQQKLDETIQNGGQVDQATYDALTREIAATESQLKTLTEKQNEASAGWQAFGAKMDEVSTKADAVAQKTAKLSTAAAGALTGMVAMAVKAGAAADDLNTLSNQTGFSTEQLQKFQYASDLVDVSMETMTGAASRMTMQLKSSEEKFANLGVATRDASGNFRDTNEIFFDTLEALGNIENGTERDVAAMDIFGKSANQLAGIIDDGGASLRALGEEASAAGLILSQDALDGANAFNDGVDRLKATAQASFMEAGATLAETLLPMLEELVVKVSEVLQWFGNLDGSTQKIILTVLALVAGISPVAKIISTISGAITTLIPIAVKLWAVLAANPIGAIITAIAALVAGFVYAYNNVEWFRNGVNKVFSGIYNTIKGVIDRIRGLFNFSWSFPKIKLPHFSWSWQSIGGLVNIPKISVDWYAKAMSDGMILNGATIFGAKDGRLLGGGEVGSEVVVGTNSLMDMIREATAGQNLNVTINAPEGANAEEIADYTIAKLQRIYNSKVRAWK